MDEAANTGERTWQRSGDPLRRGRWRRRLGSGVAMSDDRGDEVDDIRTSQSGRRWFYTRVDAVTEQHHPAQPMGARRQAAQRLTGGPHVPVIFEI
jgi:hypothetical protein